MWNWFKHLDRILRGDATRLETLSAGRIDVPARGLVFVGIIVGAFYGVCMGLFAVTGSGSGAPIQILASALKVPALFFLTLLVTLPSLYVFNALVGSRLTPLSLVRLLIASLGVMLAVLASMGPIVAFFAVTTTSYPFMILLNVVIFAASGALGLMFLLQTLNRLTIALTPPPPPAPAPQTSPAEPPGAEPSVESLQPVYPEPASEARPPGALDPTEGHVLGPHVKTVFRIWVIVFGLVGAQMGWVLRPFIGSPDAPFQWLRQRESNFFQAVIESIRQLLG